MVVKANSCNYDSVCAYVCHMLKASFLVDTLTMPKVSHWSDHEQIKAGQITTGG